MRHTIIATLKEIKDNENRVGLTPKGASELKRFGHRIIVQKGAGVGAGFSDKDYFEAGAEIMEDPSEIVSLADIVVKVKEPLPQEYPLLERMAGKTLYTYFHLSAADKALTEALVKHHISAVAYETVEDENGKLPLLAPMSEIAGILAIQYGTQYLQKKYHGRGVTLGYVHGADTPHVVVVGGGFVGEKAATTAAGMGARVTLFEINEKRIAALTQTLITILGEKLFSNVEILKPDGNAQDSVYSRTIADADLLVGAVLIKGTKAPEVVNESQVATMKKGAVIVDVAIDQGGCIWGSKATSHSDPIYHINGAIYCCVANMPGQVARQSTQALTTVTLPYLVEMANHGVMDALTKDQRFARGLNTYAGKITYKSVAEDLGMMEVYEDFAKIA